jgi:2-polyprenyl-3-methyl-5-hydroxy-6-metoxy-1,4-benzoquinol methylase
VSSQSDSDPDLDKLVAELRARVAARRESGSYPDDLEESLDKHFEGLVGPRQRIAPAMYDVLDELLHALTHYQYSRARIAKSSRLPGGELAHRVVSRGLSRQIDGILAQSQEQGAIVTHALSLLTDIMSSVGELTFTQQFDDIQQRLAEHTKALNDLEHQLLDVRQRVPGAVVESFYGEDHFTARFRGGADDLRARYREFAQRLIGCDPVLDIGFGRGELMELLVDAGVQVRGIEPDPRLVANARGRGLDVSEGTAIEYLQTLEPESLGGIVMIQVIEHLSPQQVIDFVSLAADKVRPGGKVVVETVNAESLYIYARALWLDPDHVRPVHRALLEFLFSEAGFRKLEVEWRSPVPPDEQLMDVPGDDEHAKVVDENFKRIGQLLFGPQDYALIATR